VTAPDWGTRVVGALRRYFSIVVGLMEPARQMDASFDLDGACIPVLPGLRSGA